MTENALIIAGPTASGKTDLAFEIAKLIPSVIINADSMQVYSNLSILTNMTDHSILVTFPYSSELIKFEILPKKIPMGATNATISR